MSPAGLAKIIIFPGAQKPVPGSPNPVLSQEKRPAKTTSIVMIGGQSRMDRKMAEILRQKENTTSVLNAGKHIISVVVELSSKEDLDPLMVFADLTVEIVGREKLSTGCDVLDVKIWERSERFKDREELRDCRTCIEIVVRPGTASALNWNEGTEHSMPTVWKAMVFAGDRPPVCLVNQFHGMPLLTDSKGSVR